MQAPAEDIICPGKRYFSRDETFRKPFGYNSCSARTGSALQLRGRVHKFCYGTNAVRVAARELRPLSVRSKYIFSRLYLLITDLFMLSISTLTITYCCVWVA